jgi:hypothetical protein
MKIPSCFLKYRDEGQCLLQDSASCRFCKAGTFILLRRIRDAEIRTRETILRECLHLTQGTLKDLKGGRIS